MSNPMPRPGSINPWLRAALVFLIVVDLLNVVVGLASIPAYVQRAGSGTIEPYALGANAAMSNEIVTQRAAARGMTPGQYALYESIVVALFTLLLLGVGLLTLTRARSHWFGWLTAHIMLFLASWGLYGAIEAARPVPMAWIELPSVLWPLFILYFFLFPDGRAVPRWARWPVALYLPIHFAVQLLGVIYLARPAIGEKINFLGIVNALQFLVFLILPFLLGCQVYRYFRVSTLAQRRQTKWFLYGFGMFIGLSTLTDAIWSSGQAPVELTLLAMAFLPISLAIAILRYQLWDIDVVIRRTLVYAVVTALLALVFYGAVLLTQRLFTGLTGQQSPVALVVSTLIIAALFSPLRRRVQDFVDRRFHRRKYDAQAVLSEFAAIARDETNLERLTDGFVEAVSDTVQPERVAIWLRER